MYHKVPLQGVELEEYLAKERAAKEKEAAHQAALVRNQRVLEADEDDTDSEDEDDSDVDDEDEVRDSLGGDVDMDGAASTGQVTKRRRRQGKADADDADWGDGDEGLTKQLLSFDIYLKGKISKSTTFFKSVGGQTQRFRMFPYVEKKRRVDEYGETVDVGLWLRKGKALEEEAEINDKKEQGVSLEDEDVSALYSSSFLQLISPTESCRATV
jgi:cleavage and polyadenylation specificity factor subunit 2